VAIAQRAGHLARGRVARDGVLEDSHHRVQHGDIDHLSLSRLCSALQRGENADCRKQTCGDIGDGGAHPGGRAPLGTGDAHQPTHGLDHCVVCSALAVGSALAKAGGGGIDQAGVLDMERLIAEAQTGHRPGPKVFQHNICLARQAEEQLPGRRVLEV